MSAGTRQSFREELATLEARTLDALDIVCGSIDRALEALAHRDIELTTLIVGEDDRLDRRYAEVHQGVLTLLALQSPVAGDLRLVAALLHVIKHAERMGDQCVNVAKLIPFDGPDGPRDAQILSSIQRMGMLARSLAAQSKHAFARRDVALAEDLLRQDDEIDLLNRAIFRRVIEVGDDPCLREWGMHMMMIARALERIGDNAVDIGEQTAFVVTGLFREFADASHPSG